jgi:hypothetical protein
MLKEDQIQREAQDAMAVIENVVQQTRQAENAALNELATLKQRWPELLLEAAMGRADSAHKSAMRARIRSLEEEIGDFPVLYQQLEAERLRVTQRIREATRIRKARERYEATKETLLQEYGIAHVNEIRSLAKYLGMEGDCEAFLTALLPDSAA